MSYQNSNILIQQFVDNYGNVGRTYEVFDFIADVSSANNKVNLDPSSFLKAPGKKRQVRLNFWPIQCDVEGSCDTALCDAADEILEPQQVTFDIERCYATLKYGIDVENVRLVDNSGWNYEGIARAIVTSVLPQARRELAIDYTTRLYQLAGVHPDGNLQKRVTTTNPATGIINPMGLLDMQVEYTDAGFSEPYIYGGREVKNYQAMTAIGGLNASGQRIDMLDTDNLYYDSGLSTTILNDNPNGGHILTIAPETFKYVWYLNNAGIFRTDLASIDDIGQIYFNGVDGFMKGIFIDPVTGVAFDLYVNYDKCNDRWTLQLKHTYDFFVLPEVACNIQGVNGLMHWRTCPLVVAPCATGDAPSPAVTPSTFSWTPGDILSLTATSILLGGIYNDLTSGTSVGVSVTTLNQLAALLNDNYNGQIFSVSGSDIVYSGVTAITGNINGGSAAGGIDITFA